MARGFILLVLLLAGCAAGGDLGIGSGDGAVAPVSDQGTASARPISAVDVQLTPEELQMDCRRLRGRMQIRIVELRAKDRHETSDVSRMAQQLVTPVFGGTSRGADPTGELATDRARLDAYNRQLVAKGCKAVDIEAELKGS